MDEFDAIVNLPSREEILARIDEYTLYRYYTEIDDLVPGMAHRSPLREDHFPSFSVFPAARGRGWDEFEYTWKDHKLNESGNIFKLIRLLKGFNTFEEVYALIGKDFDLGFNSADITPTKICLYTKPDAVEAKIRVKSIPFTNKGLNFWTTFGINKDLLDAYCTTQIQHYWSSPKQEAPRAVLDPTFAYRIGEHYQIYSPFATRDLKFRNDLPPEYFFGYLQLPKNGDTLIIDKSSKDCIFCRVLDYWAVAGKSETTEIPERKMWELKERFKRVFLMLDPDVAGERQTELYLAKYPWLEPRFLTLAKDKTDLCKLVGIRRTKEIIDELLV